MALLLVSVPDPGTLLLNEFFDYDGCCYGMSAPRGTDPAEAIRLEDFYEATVRTEQLENVPVLFLVPEGESYTAVGFYRRAQIHRRLLRISLFMEGNIRAEAGEAVLLPDRQRVTGVEAHFGDRCYEVVETDDARYEAFMALISRDVKKTGNAMPRYDRIDISISPAEKRDAGRLRERCDRLAAALMADECRDLADIKSLEVCADRLTVLNGRSADG